MNSLSPCEPAIAIPDFSDIEDAAQRLKGQAVRTPLLESPLLNRRVGGRLLVKAEVLQRTGSFKFRGAYNHISRLDSAQIKAGIVAYSSGNHAQGVAAAAEIVGAPATIIMPSDAPALKIANTKAYGAEVLTYDRYHQDRETIGAEMAAETGASLVRPYDDAWVIAGQGTVGLEITEQCAELGIVPDAVLSPAGGGGLIAGTSLALEARLPIAKLYACEPEGFDDHRRSLEAGDRTANDDGPKSFCDALLASIPGEMTFAINRDRLAGGFAVSDEEVAAAMAIAFTDLKIVVEPGGAVALAAALAGRIKTRDRTTVVVTSGGNVDPVVFDQVLRNAG
jgi:threonine dehydratase